MSKNRVNPYFAGFIVETQSHIQDLLFGLLEQRDELTQQRDELTQQRDELTQQRDELTQQRDDLISERDAATETLSAVVNSRIWRLTRIYRKLRSRKP